MKRIFRTTIPQHGHLPAHLLSHPVHPSVGLLFNSGQLLVSLSLPNISLPHHGLPRHSPCHHLGQVQISLHHHPNVKNARNSLEHSGGISTEQVPFHHDPTS